MSSDFKCIRKLVLYALLLFVVGGILFFSYSYAIFKRQMQGADVTLKVGELQYKIESSELTNYQITVKPNSSEIVDLQLISKNPIDSKYELYYKIVSPQNLENMVDGGYLETSLNSAEGIINASDEKQIQVVLNNNGDQQVVIEIGLAAGFTHNSLVLQAGEKSLKEVSFQKYFVFDYTGDFQTFTTPIAGNYKVQLWGASGKNNFNDYVSNNPAYGAYTEGIISLMNQEQLYVYVGGVKQLFNCCAKQVEYGPGSGGATDIRLVSGIWNDSTSLASRIMVAGGAGGGYNDLSASGGAAAGGLQSYRIEHQVYPVYEATQVSGGLAGYLGTAGGFGYGGINEHHNYNSGAGGYYGGGSGPAGGGGSSYISGHVGCIAIQSSTNIVPKVSTYSKIEDSYHYSGKIFTNTVMIDGKGHEWKTTTVGNFVGMPTHDLTSTMTGNDGAGYAKITYLGD